MRRVFYAKRLVTLQPTYPLSIGTIAPILTADLAALCTDSLPHARRLTKFFGQPPPDHSDLQRTHRTILIPAKAPKTGTLPPFAIAKHHHPFHLRLT